MEHLRATVRACEITPTCAHPVLHAGAQHRARVDELLTRYAPAGESYALFMPGCQAAGYLKRWGWRRYAALAARSLLLILIACCLAGIQKVQRNEDLTVIFLLDRSHSVEELETSVATADGRHFSPELIAEIEAA